MDQKKIDELQAAASAAKQAATDAGGTDEALNKASTDAESALQAAKAPSLDPVKAELERVRGKTEGKTKLEKIQYRKKLLDEEEIAAAKEAGVDLSKTAETSTEIPEWYRKAKQEEAQRTAFQMADSEITDEHERELVKHHLESTIRPSGNPTQDLQAARAIVNSVKNSRIAEEALRKPRTAQHSSGAGAAGKGTEEAFVPTAEEAGFMRSFGMTENDIKKARDAQAKLDGGK